MSEDPGDRERSERKLLGSCLSDVARTLEPSTALENLLDRVLSHLDAAVGCIWVQPVDGGGPRTLAASRHSPALAPAPLEPGALAPGAPEPGARSDLLDRVEDTGEALAAENLPAPAGGSSPSLRSILAAPVCQGGRVLGVLEVAHPDPGALHAADLPLLVEVATCAVGALRVAGSGEGPSSSERRDALTGLATHARFWARLEVEFQRAERHRRCLGLVLVDVDDFKAYNDRLGHPAGDDALATVARILASGSRAHDLVARYGGQEFGVLLPETDEAGALCFAEKVRHSVEAACFGPGGVESLTVSVGVACSAGEVATPRELMALTRERLDLAKAEGRNQVRSGLD